MTTAEKREVITQIAQLLEKLIDTDSEELAALPAPAAEGPVEMLTIKECAQLVNGLSEHTVRHLVMQDKVASIRTGVGRNGKILVNKVSLLNYLERKDVESEINN